jgi:hypothetical protein
MCAHGGPLTTEGRPFKGAARRHGARMGAGVSTAPAVDAPSCRPPRVHMRTVPRRARPVVRAHTARPWPAPTERGSRRRPARSMWAGERPPSLVATGRMASVSVRARAGCVCSPGFPSWHLSIRGVRVRYEGVSIYSRRLQVGVGSYSRCWQLLEALADIRGVCS